MPLMKKFPKLADLQGGKPRPTIRKSPEEIEAIFMQWHRVMNRPVRKPKGAAPNSKGA